MSTESSNLSKIGNELRRVGIPNAFPENVADVISGFCVVGNDNVWYHFAITEIKDHYKVVMIVPYIEEALASGEADFLERLAAVNLKLLNGNFNYDKGARRLMFKWVLPVAGFELTTERIKSLVLLPAAMILKYHDELCGLPGNATTKNV